MLSQQPKKERSVTAPNDMSNLTKLGKKLRNTLTYHLAK